MGNGMLNIGSRIRTLVGTCTLKEKHSQKPGPNTEMGTLIQEYLTQVKSVKTLSLNIIVTTFHPS